MNKRITSANEEKIIKINLKKRVLSLLLSATISVGLMSSMIATASAASNDYTTWKQQDSAWNQAQAWPKSQYPGATSYTFSQAGCLVTSIAMLLRHYNIETADVNTFNPWVLNERLKAVGGFTPSANLIYGSIEKVYPAFKYAGQTNYSKETLDYLYGYGYACILQVNGGGHYVAVKSVNGDTVEIMDPGYSSRSTLADYQGQASEIIYYSTSGYSPNSSSAQPIANGTYYLQSGLNNQKVLDMDNVNDNAQLWVIGHDTNQHFQVQYQSNGYYTIKCVKNGKALDVQNAEKKNGTNVWFYSANGTDAQLWKIIASKNGSYTITSKVSGLALDVCDGKTNDGTNIQCWRQNGTASQDWKFVSVNSPASSSTSNAQYFPRYNGNTTSIVDALNSLGIDSNYSHRKQIASSNNIQNYSGTFAQNTQMLNLLKQGKLKK